MKINDEQRLVFLRDFLALLGGSKYKDEPLLKKVEERLNSLESAFANPPSKRSGGVTLGEPGERLDAAIRALRNGLAYKIDEFFALGEDAKHQIAEEVLRAIFPEGLSAVIYIPNEAEIAASKALLYRCEGRKSDLQSMGLDGLLPTIERCLDLLSASADEKAKPVSGLQSADMVAARKLFQGTVVDLKRYLKSRFSGGDAEEKAFQTRVLTLLKQSLEASA